MVDHEHAAHIYALCQTGVSAVLSLLANDFGAVWQKT